MICIDKKLINEELMDSRISRLRLTFTYKKLSKKYLDWLFRHYYVREIVENFYDSEPDFDEEEFNIIWIIHHVKNYHVLQSGTLQVISMRLRNKNRISNIIKNSYY